MRRVVVTGLGVLSPLGVGAERSFGALLEGRSGVRAIEHFDVSDLPAKIAGQVPRGAAPGEFDANAVAPPKEQRRMDDFMLFALAASEEAVADAGWKDLSDGERERTGVLIGSGIGGIRTIAENCGKDGAVIADEVATRGEKNANMGYDANTDDYVDMLKAGIIDPLRVTRSALTNAASIAGLMLTTEVMVTKIDEDDKKSRVAGAIA